MAEQKTKEEIQVELQLLGIEIKDAILHNIKTYCSLQYKLSQEPVKSFYRGIVSFVDAISLVGLHYEILKK